MPLADPLLPNLAIEQLAEIARSEGIECDVLYGTLHLGPRVPLGFIHSMMGPAIFAPAYHDVDEIDLLEEVAKEIALMEETDRRRSIDVDDLVLRLLDYECEARLCIERCAAAIKLGIYDIVGFSIGFDSQKLASALLAKHLKRLEAPPWVVFGGTGCDGPMADAVLEAFPEVDCVVNGEATETFCRLIQWLRDPSQTHKPTGVAMRSDQADPSFGESPPAPPIEHVPDPDYTAFIEQRRNSLYNRQGLTLFFETSRGCWWGRKQHCTFCGIKTVRDPWRTTDSREALRRIETMYAEYAPDLLYCVDAILDFKHMKDLLPALAERRRIRGNGPALFYELKSNLKRSDVALLAQAGVVRAQPGIENFSNHVLRQMRKGVRGLDQVAVLKWCAAYGIDLIYGYLSGIPEETPADVWQAVKVIPHLHHLQPPVGVNVMGLHRFSPYQVDPDRYGLKDIRPFELQRLMFRMPDSVLKRLC
ncbi:RiPP maturation radical SAM C-methyltransferase [Cereibacter sphaeroides]|nr:RiPP maturation radical SAM C-methyltransferase [Cereibacter sphaeroides]